MDRLLIMSMLLGAGLIVAILFSLRREHIRPEYSLSWLSAGVLVFVLSRWPSLLTWVAGVMGFESAQTALFAITFAIFLVVLYRLSMIVSSLKDNNIALAQKVAILEYHARRNNQQDR